MTQPPKPGSSGQFSPDGRWFWDGNQWIPTDGPSPKPAAAEPTHAHAEAPKPGAWQQQPQASFYSPQRREIPRRWLVAGGVAGIIVLVVAAFFTVRALTGGGTHGGGPSTPLSGQFAWEAGVPVPKATTSDQQVNFKGGFGSWMGQGQLTLLSAGVIASYDMTGKKRWTLGPPTPFDSFCGGSLAVAGGVGLVAFGSNGKCNNVLAVDTATGTKRWQWGDSNSFDLNGIHAEVVGTTVMADVTGLLVGLSVSDGHLLWLLRDPKLTSDPYAGCTASDFLAAASAATVLFSCDSKAGYQEYLTQVDPGGTIASKALLPKQLVSGEPGSEGTLVSLDPVVIQVGEVSGSNGRYVVVDTGGQTHVIQQTGAYGELDMSGEGLFQTRDLHVRYPVVVTNGLLVTRTKPAQASANRTSNKLVAFDITTGQMRWSKQLINTSNSVPVAVDGGNLVAMVTGVYENPPQVFKVDLKSGKAASLGPPYPRSLINIPESSTLLWQGGRMYGVGLSATSAALPGFQIYALK